MAPVTGPVTTDTEWADCFPQGRRTSGGRGPFPAVPDTTAVPDHSSPYQAGTTRIRFPWSMARSISSAIADPRET